MGIFKILNNLVFTSNSFDDIPLEKQREALRQAWGLDHDDPVIEAKVENVNKAVIERNSTFTEYDQHLWQNKMIRLTDDARQIARIDFASRFSELMSDYEGLGVSAEVAEQTAQTAFQTAVRHIVSDRHISLAELAYLNSLRIALEISEEKAHLIIRNVVEEAEAIFEQKIEGYNLNLAIQN